MQFPKPHSYHPKLQSPHTLQLWFLQHLNSAVISTSSLGTRYTGHFIEIAPICSEMGFTKGPNKNLNDQLKGQLQQTVDRRYQNGKPDKFDVFTVHCPPSTIGCRYLVVANILDNTLGKQKDHHKFLQQILHNVLKEAESDTLEMPTVAIAIQSFAIGGFPADTILPSFIRMFSTSSLMMSSSLMSGSCLEVKRIIPIFVQLLVTLSLFAHQPNLNQRFIVR